jgi:molybdenum cofactor synthesis domain-containing protein
MTTAAAIIIGNEILTGKYRDENGPWLASELRRLGVDLIRILTIPDEVGVIADAVRECTALADTVFTSGGVGPTHDDVTFAGVAAGLGVPIARNEGMARAIQAKMGPDFTEDALRMADLPDGTVLHGSGIPVFVCQSVVILPGVPRYFRSKFAEYAPLLEGVPVQSRSIQCAARETAIASTLRDAAERWPQVDIGSYPRFEATPPHVIITLDSRDLNKLEEAHQWLQDRLAPDS